MMLEYDTASDEYKVECDNCHRQWLYEGYELVLDPWPHFECPVCGEWIPVF